VSNAGLLRSGPILRLDDDDLRLLLDVHVTAAFRLVRVIGGYWRAEAKAGRTIDAAVVLTTSSAGLYGFRAEAAYSAAKAAVAMLARIGADELGRYGQPSTPSRPWHGPVSPTGGETQRGPVGDPLAAEHIAPVIAWLLAARHAVPAAAAHVARGGRRSAAPRPRQRHATTSAAHLAARSRRA
jgi:NAD(P)-dependent dehydrogenase (short-subunit alcohol dehydrogenase family)